MNLRKKALLASLALTGSSLFAAVPVEVSDAATAFAADAALYGGVFLTLAVGVSTAKIGIKWVKSFVSSST